MPEKKTLFLVCGVLRCVGMLMILTLGGMTRAVDDLKNFALVVVYRIHQKHIVPLSGQIFFHLLLFFLLFFSCFCDQILFSFNETDRPPAISTSSRSNKEERRPCENGPTHCVSIDAFNGRQQQFSLLLLVLRFRNFFFFFFYFCRLGTLCSFNLFLFLLPAACPSRLSTFASQ